MNDLLLRALRCQNTQQRPPVWLMRQAGRYMPEYRALRAKYSFLEMCHHPELVAEVTQLPIRAFGMDAAILFSDILMIPEALNVGLRFEEKAGPIIERPLTSPEEVRALPSIDVAEALQFVAQGIKLLKPQLQVPLLGFCGAPFTVASYMIEGGSSKDLRKTKRWMFRDPQSFHQLLTKIADDSIAYLKMQIAAGVDAVQIFDSWANALAPESFRQFSLQYLRRMVEALRPSKIPVILFGRGFSTYVEELAALQPAGISLDWNGELSRVRQQIPKTVAVQGNLDPDVLYAPASVVKNEVQRLLQAMQGDPGYIFNLGHGILPDVPVDNVRVLIDTVKSA